MRRGRPGTMPRGGGRPHTRRPAGEERTLASVEAVPEEDTAGAEESVPQPRDARPPRRMNGPRAVPDASSDIDAGSERDTASAPRVQDQPRLWHITLSVSGAEAPLAEVRRGLEQLAHDHPFLLTSRYANDHAEIRYWEEARDLHDAAAIALRLWGEHRSSANLPPWETVGLEVIDRETYHHRIAEGYGPLPATPVGVHPF